MIKPPQPNVNPALIPALKISENPNASNPAWISAGSRIYVAPTKAFAFDWKKVYTYIAHFV